MDNMNEIGLFLSTFGGGGLFIWYLLNKERTTTKEMIEAVKTLARVSNTQGDCIDDLTVGINDLLDYMMPSHARKRQVKDIRSRIDERRVEREKSEFIQKNN